MVNRWAERAENPHFEVPGARIHGRGRRRAAAGEPAVASLFELLQHSGECPAADAVEKTF